MICLNQVYSRHYVHSGKNRSLIGNINGYYLFFKSETIMFKQTKILCLGLLAISASSFAITNNVIKKNLPKTEVIYVEHKQTNKISAYKIDPVSGDLTRLDKGNIFTEYTPGDIAIFQDKAVYSVSDVSSNISRFTILPNGELRREANVPSGLAPWSTKISTSGKYAYSASHLENTMSMYKINQDTGALEAQTPAKIKIAAYGPSGLGINPLDPKHLYTASFLSDHVNAFNVDPDTGLLEDKGKTYPSGLAPRAFAFDNDNHAYVLNLQSVSISQYNADTTTGDLKPMAVASVRTGMDPMAFTMDKSKSYLYVASKSENKVYMYKKQADGSLEPLTPKAVDTGSYGPRSLGVDEHHHLYVTNMLSDAITKFDIESDGTLSNRKVFHFVYDPEVMGIVALNLQENPTINPASGRLPW